MRFTSAPLKYMWIAGLLFLSHSSMAITYEQLCTESAAEIQNSIFINGMYLYLEEDEEINATCDPSSDPECKEASEVSAELDESSELLMATLRSEKRGAPENISIFAANAHENASLNSSALLLFKGEFAIKRAEVGEHWVFEDKRNEKTYYCVSE